jgi:hypothetical protein
MAFWPLILALLSVNILVWLHAARQKFAIIQ